MTVSTIALGGELQVSRVGLGCNNLGRSNTASESQAGTDAVIGAAIDAGVTFFDVADMYGNPAGLSEERLGVAIRGRRDEVVVASKFGHPRTAIDHLQTLGPKGARRYVERALNDSLTRLGIETIDLYQIHWPDTDTPIADTVEVLLEAQHAGKVRYLGNSNFGAVQLREAQRAAESAGTRFISAQNEYSLVERGVEGDVLPTVVDLGMGFLPFFPLADGLLTGKYTQSGGPADGRLTVAKPELLDAANWEQLGRYQALCDEAGVTMLQATFAWLLAQPGVASVIAGATKPEQIQQNAEAGTTALPGNVLEAISEIFAT